MLSLSLLLNCTATIGLASAVVLDAVYDETLVSLGLAYGSGLMTAFASRYEVRVGPSPIKRG